MAKRKPKESKSSNNNRVRFLRPIDGDLNSSLRDAIARAIRIENTIVDRRAGSTVVEEICGETTNLAVVAYYMKEEGVRNTVAKWFLENQVVKVIEQNIHANTITVGEAQATSDGLLGALNASIQDKSAYNVICEFVFPLAYKAGLLNDNTKVTRTLEFPAQTLTVSDLTLDLAAQNAVRTAETITVRMHESGKMSKLAYARLFAEALNPIGYELHRAMNIQNIFEDVVKAIHVKLLSSMSSAMVGEVDSRWLEHPIVDELSRNFVFVQAALDIPIGTNLALKNDVHTLEKEAPIALASLKGSRRYQIVGRDEYLRTYGKKTIVNVEGEPVYFFGWRNAGLASVAQCVSVFADAVMPKAAKNVIPGPDGVTKFVAAAVPKGESSTIGFHVNNLIHAVTHLAETGDPRMFYKGEGGSDQARFLGEAFFLGDDGENFSRELAAMMAEHCYLNYTEENGVEWLYCTHTSYNRYVDQNWAMCYLPSGEFITNDIGLFFLVTKDIAPTTVVEPRSQLLSDKALYTRVMDLEEEERTVKKERVSFSVSLANENISGSVQTTDIGMQDLPDEANFVIPVHNRLVIDTISAVHDSFDSIVSSARDVASKPFGDGEILTDSVNVAVTPQLVDFLSLQRARTILEFAQSVSPQYRQIVASVMRMRVTSGKTAAQILRLRGTMQQQSFNAYADVFGLVLILVTNGLNAEFVKALMAKPEMVQAIMLTGSDRVKH